MIQLFVGVFVLLIGIKMGEKFFYHRDFVEGACDLTVFILEFIEYLLFEHPTL